MEQFIEWLDSIGRENAATLLGVTSPAICHWLKGRRRITPQMAMKIEKVTRGKVRAIDLVFPQ